MKETDRLMLMAYVDGELAASEHALFEARLARDPGLAQAVARERALRDRLQANYGAVLDEPMPARLADLLRRPTGPRLAPPPAAPHRPVRPARRWQWPEWGAMAACLAAGIFLGARAVVPGAPGESPASSRQVALAEEASGLLTAQGTLRDALEQRAGADDEAGPAGRRSDGASRPGGDADVRIGLTFRNHAQEYCRTFTLAGASSGIACKHEGRWAVADLERSLATSSAPSSAATDSAGASSRAPAEDAYRSAASAQSPTLLQAVDALRDGDTLDAAGEAAARAAGWRH